MDNEMEIQEEMELLKAGRAMIIAALETKGVVSKLAAEDIVDRYTPIVMMKKVFWKNRQGDYIPDIVQDSYKSTPSYFGDTQKEQSGTDVATQKEKDDLQERVMQAVATGNMSLYRELRKKQGAKLK